MADKVRVTGVALEIQGAKEFDASLKKAAQNIKQTTAELKRSQSQHKLSENSVTSLADKQSALTKALEAQKSKTAELNKILEVAKEKYGEESKQVSAVATEIAKSETYEADLEQQMKETQKAVEDQSHSLKKYVAELTTAGKGVEGFGDKLSGVGKKLTVGVTTPTVALGTAATTMWQQYEKSAAKVATIMDTQVMSANEMKSNIHAAATEIGYDASEFAEATYSAISASVATDKAVEFVKDAAKLTEAGFTDLSSSIDVQTTILNAYQMSADKASYVSDILIQTQNKGKTTVDELAKSWGKVIPQAASYNVSLEDLGASTAILTANGIDTAQSCTYLKEMLVELNKSSSKVAKTIKSQTGKSFSDLMKDGRSVGDVLSVLGIDCSNLSKKVKQLTDGGTSFDDALAKLIEDGDTSATKFAGMWGSTTAATAALSLLTAGSEKYSETLDTMRESTGLTSSSFDTMQTDGVKLEKETARLKNQFMKFGETLTPVVTEATEGLSILTEWFGSLSESQRKTIVYIAAGVAGLGPLLTVGGKVISTGSKAVKGVKKIAKSLETSKMAAKLFAKETDGAATAMNNMANASKAASLASKGVYTAASPAAVGVAALAASGALVIGTFAAAKKSQEDFAESLSRVPKAMSDFNNSVETAKSRITGLNKELFITSSESAGIDEGIEKAQQNIIGIAKRAAKKSRAITDAEYAEIERLIGAIDSYTAKKLEAYQAQQGAVAAMIKTETNMTAAAAADYTAQAENAYNEAIEAAKNAKADAYTLAYTTFSEQEELWKNGKITDAAYGTAQENYQKALNDANEKYNTAMAQANGSLASSMEEVAQKYEQQNIANDENIQLIIQKQQELENAKKRAEELAAEYERLKESGASQDELDKVLEEHDQAWRDYEACSDDLEDSLNNLSEKSADMLGTWLSLTSEAELFGGKASESAKTMATAITDGLDTLPSGVKKVYEDAMKGALEELNKKNPELYEEASTSCDGVLKTMRETFDEHSPSKETRKIFRYAMDGGILGLKDKEEELYKKADAIAANTAKRLKKGLEVNSPSRVARRIFWSVGDGGIFGLKDKEKELYATSTRLASGVAKRLSIQRPAFDVNFGSIAAAQARANRIASSISNTNNYTTNTDYSQHDYGIHVDRVVVNGSESDAHQWLEEVEYQRQLQARARGAR